MRENELGRRFAVALRAKGAMVYSLVGGAHLPPGWPDKLVWSPIWDGLVELKQRGGAMRAHQLPVLRMLHERRPGHVFVVRHEVLAVVRVCSPLDGERALAECALDELIFKLKELATWRG